jgi:membrane-associated phospholipid phosphatase
MHTHSNSWRLLWIANGVLAGVTGLLFAAFGLRIDWASALPSVLVAGALLAVWAGYALIRPDERLAALGMGGAILIVYTNIGAVYSYGTTAAGLPLLDATMAAADRRLGFDWLGYLAWTGSHPWLVKLLRGAYFSSLYQVVAAVIVLALTGQILRLAGFLWLFIGTSLVIISLSAVFPAAGAFVHHDPPAALRGAVGADAGLWHLQHFNGLRQGTMTVVDLARIEGLVTFPSFHTALAIISAWAFWTVPRVRWFATAASALVIASTPGIGGHYLIDVLAGALIAVVAIRLVPSPAEWPADPVAKVAPAYAPAA